MGIGIINIVKTDFITNDVWIGGETGIFAPYISKSTDLGNSWNTVYPDLGGDNACNSLLLSPNDTSIVYAGMEGLVIKTTDGGTIWNPTGLTNTPYYFYALGYISFSNTLYAGGSTNSNEFGLYYSNDGGENWMQFQPQIPSSTTMLSISPRTTATCSSGNCISSWSWPVMNPPMMAAPPMLSGRTTGRWRVSEPPPMIRSSSVTPTTMVLTPKPVKSTEATWLPWGSWHTSWVTI